MRPRVFLDLLALVTLLASASFSGCAHVTPLPDAERIQPLWFFDAATRETRWTTDVRPDTFPLFAYFHRSLHPAPDTLVTFGNDGRVASRRVSPDSLAVPGRYGRPPVWTRTFLGERSCETLLRGERWLALSSGMFRHDPGHRWRWDVVADSTQIGPRGGLLTNPRRSEWISTGSGRFTQLNGAFYPAGSEIANVGTTVETFAWSGGELVTVGLDPGLLHRSTQGSQVSLVRIVRFEERGRIRSIQSLPGDREILDCWIDAESGAVLFTTRSARGRKELLRVDRDGEIIVRVLDHGFGGEMFGPNGQCFATRGPTEAQPPGATSRAPEEFLLWDTRDLQPRGSFELHSFRVGDRLWWPASIVSSSHDRVLALYFARSVEDNVTLSGSRHAYVWCERNGSVVSTIDLPWEDPREGIAKWFDLGVVPPFGRLLAVSFDREGVALIQAPVEE